MTRCIYCSAPLGGAEALKGVPGARFAFEADAPRAWVVCPRCARWALLPATLRAGAWRALDEAFGHGVDVVESENVAQRRCDEALTVIRVGSADDVERAVWRYAGFGGNRPFWLGEARALAQIVGGVAGVLALPMLLSAPVWTGGALAYAGPVAGVALGWGIRRGVRRERRPLFRLPAERSPTGAEIVLGQPQVARSRLVRREGGAALVLPEAGYRNRARAEPLHLGGDDLRLLLMRLFPLRAPGSCRHDDLLRVLARKPGGAREQLEAAAEQRRLTGFGSTGEPDAGNQLTGDEVIALEAALHHEMEEDASAAFLERAWLHADELAR